MENKVIAKEYVDKIEIWKDIKDYEGLYQVSNLGNVKSLAKTRKGTKNKEDMILKLCNKDGYKVVNLWKNKKKKTIKVHRLVAEAFIPNNQNKPYINHINAIRSDNTTDNLEWCTQKENIKHAYNIGMMRTKKIKQFDKQNNYIKTWKSIREAGETLGISESHIINCYKGQRKSAGGYIWKNVI